MYVSDANGFLLPGLPFTLFFAGNSGLTSSTVPLNVSNLLFSCTDDVWGDLSRSSADFVIPVLPENVSNFCDELATLPNVSNRCPKSGGEFVRSPSIISRLRRRPIVSSLSPRMLSVLNRRTLSVEEFDLECPSRFMLNNLGFGLALGFTIVDVADEAMD